MNELQDINSELQGGKSHNCEIKIQNYIIVVVVVYYYSMAEISFHT